jgi:hypothetical protein
MGKSFYGLFRMVVTFILWCGVVGQEEKVASARGLDNGLLLASVVLKIVKKKKK